MAYTAEFETLRGEKYTLTIGGASDDDEELALAGDNPVIIEYEQDDIFKPLKKSACSVTVLAKTPLLDLYSGTLNGVTLTVERGGEQIWFGFLTPNVYSSEYKDVWDEMTLEFVDPLSAMENVKFSYFGDNFFATFSEYITQALSAVGASLEIEGLPADLSSVGCMQRNFIDETADEDDGAMTWQEVMESILRYMNKTAICYGSKLIIYDPLQSGGNSYDIARIGVAEGNGSISMGEVYNKVTVVANTNPIDVAINELLANSNLTSVMANGLTYKEYTVGTKSVIAAFYRNNAYSFSPSLFYWNLGNVSSAEIGDTSINQGFPPNYQGSFIQRIAYWNTDDGKPGSLSWNKYLTFFQPSLVAKSLGMDGITLSEETMFMGTGYLVLSMKFIKFNNTTAFAISLTDSDEKFDADGQYLFPCTLQIGGKYFNGTDWQTTACTFNVAMTYKEGEKIYDTEFSIDNTVTYDLNLVDDLEGFLIPLEGSMYGKINFSLQNCGTSVHISELKLTQVASDSSKDIFNIVDYEADVTYTNVINEDNVAEGDDIEMRVNSYNSKATSSSFAMQKGTTDYAFYLPSTLPEQECISRMVSYYSEPRLQYQNTLNDKISAHLSPFDNISIAALGNFTMGSVTFNLANDSADVTLLQL